MTKILVGLDTICTTDAVPTFKDSPGYSAVVRLLKDLRFPLASFDIAHVATPYAPETFGLESLLVAQEDIDRVFVEEQEYADRVTRDALWVLREGAVDTHTSILRGNPVASLMERADTTAADLIAVNASHTKGPLDALLTGSVARSLVIGAHQSVLLARPRMAADTPIRAVLATDHSPYSIRAVELLGRLAPQGITNLTVMTAYPKRQLHTMGKFTTAALDPASAFREAICARNETVIEVLSHHLAPGTTFSSLALAMPIHEAIEHAMRESDANLLILGAKGHGFVERTLLGSVSFRQTIVSAPYSVLILRP